MFRLLFVGTKGSIGINISLDIETMEGKLGGKMGEFVEGKVVKSWIMLWWGTNNLISLSSFIIRNCIVF